MNLLDLILLAMLGWASWKGYKKGVFATVSSVAGYVIGLIGTFVFYQPLRVILSRDLKLGEKLAPWVTETLALPVSSFQTKINDMAMDKAIEMINQKPLPGVFKEIMAGYVQELAKLPSSQGVNSLGDGIVYIVSDLLISAAALFILFCGLTLLFRVILPRIFRSVTPRPLSIIDKLGGGLLGICGGIISLAVLITILTPLTSLWSLQGNPGFLAEQMQSSFLVNTFLENIQDVFGTFFTGGSV